MKVSLEDWLSEGRLRQYKTSKNEIKQLLAVFARDMADAQSNASRQATFPFKLEGGETWVVKSKLGLRETS